MPRLLLAIFLLLPAVLMAQDTTSCATQEGLQYDLDGDMLVGVGDLVQFLSWFSTNFDVDQDGVLDCEDECVGAYDECGVCNGPGPQVLEIDTIISTYDSVYVDVTDDWLVYELSSDTLFSLVCDDVPDVVCNGDNLSTVTIANNTVCTPNVLVNGNVVATDLGIQEEVTFEVNAGVICVQSEYGFISACNSESFTIEVACGEEVVINIDGIGDTIPCDAPLCGGPVLYDGYLYSTVQFGDQCWFSKNLRTTVYSNGDIIPSGLDDESWSTTTTGASAVNGEGISNCENFSPDFDACSEVQSLGAYGRLYNWYAVDDYRGLCPDGWHVPSDMEWTALESHLAELDSTLALGNALKSTSGWYSGGNGIDSFGFGGVPGGDRYVYNGPLGITGFFTKAGKFGNWWSSSQQGANAMMRILRYDQTAIYSAARERSRGYSVRCLKDVN